VIRTFPAVQITSDGEGRTGAARCQPDASVRVQLRHETLLTSEAYVAQSAWANASLAVCPRHPRGGCGLARHGTYPRKTPVGMQVARYYCPTARETFSLLPDCLASRFPSDLDDLERVVTHVEGARSIEAAADVLRPDIELPSAVRWVRRRLCLVRATLILALTLITDVGVAEARLTAVRTAWDTDRALVALRTRAAAHLAAWPRPLGFGPHRSPQHETVRGVPHAMGPDTTGPPD
jgi:hypothetical protein